MSSEKKDHKAQEIIEKKEEWTTPIIITTLAAELKKYIQAAAWSGTCLTLGR